MKNFWLEIPITICLIIFVVLLVAGCVVISENNNIEISYAESINKTINKKYTYVTDTELFGKSDVWQTPLEFMVNGKGDCEDFAIYKAYRLKQVLPDIEYEYAVVRLISTDEVHMVLVVKGYVLDNNSDNLITLNEAHYVYKDWLYFDQEQIDFIQKGKRV